MMLRTACFGLILSALLAPACDPLGSSCPLEDEYCADDDTRFIWGSCEHNNTDRLSASPCGPQQVCIDTGDVHGAICADSRDKAPECAAYEHRSPHKICIDGAPANCIAGYPADGEACDEQCFESVSCGAVCAIAPAMQHEACTEPNAASVCDGGTRVTCSCGEASVETVCDDFCVFIAAWGGNPGRSLCAETPDKDPRCPNYPEEFCDGNTRVECDEGFIVGRASCASCTTDKFDNVTCS